MARENHKQNNKTRGVDMKKYKTKVYDCGGIVIYAGIMSDRRLFYTLWHNGRIRLMTSDNHKINNYILTNQQ